MCRELPLPEAEPELEFRERERDRKAPLIRARDAALPLREPSNDALELAEMKVQKEGQHNLRVCAPRLSGRPPDQTPVRLPSRCWKRG